MVSATSSVLTWRLVRARACVLCAESGAPGGCVLNCHCLLTLALPGRRVSAASLIVAGPGIASFTSAGIIVLTMAVVKQRGVPSPALAPQHMEIIN